MGATLPKPTGNREESLSMSTVEFYNDFNSDADFVVSGTEGIKSTLSAYKADDSGLLCCLEHGDECDSAFARAVSCMLEGRHIQHAKCYREILSQGSQAQDFEYFRVDTGDQDAIKNALRQGRPVLTARASPEKVPLILTGFDDMGFEAVVIELRSPPTKCRIENNKIGSLFTGWVVTLLQ